MGRKAPVLIDQEGGRVQRMTQPHWRQWLPPFDYVARFGAGEAMWLRGRLIAAELSAVGINVNCGPTLDVAQEDTHPFLRNRCYGSDVDTVIEAGKSFADGLAAGGVHATPKHMPGHGRARVDSHHDLPMTDAPLGELEATDFRPFRAFSDAPMGMSAHVLYTSIDDKLPGTTSPVCNDYIRQEIGFAGLLMTDDISMNALGGTVTERSVAALGAGCDLVLHCNGDMEEMSSIARHCGMMSDAAQRRADDALAPLAPAREMSVEEAQMRLQDLMEGLDA